MVYTYDAAHRVIQLQDGLGNTVAYTHDVMGNVTQTQTKDPAGALARMQMREYDALNRLSKDVGAVHRAAEVTRYAYDNGGNLLSVTDPLGNVTSHVYDPLNRVKQVIEPAAKAGAAAATTEYTYDLQDNITAIRTVDPSRIPTRYTFDGLGNLTAVDSPRPGSRRGCRTPPATSQRD